MKDATTSVKGIHITKGLETQLSKLKGEVISLTQEKSNIDKSIIAKKKQMNEIQDKINKLNVNSDLRITEHALLRYLERIVDKNLDELRQEILCENIINQWKVLGNGTFVHPKGFKCIVKDNMIISIIV